MTIVSSCLLEQVELYQKGFPFDLNCVKHLYLDRLRLGKLKVITCYLCLIRSFQCLQHMEIEISVGNSCFTMLPNGKELPCQSVPLDVLSSLPENVIDDILICLPLDDAVRTSILSSKWRYNWRRMPQLELDETLWETTRDIITKFTDIIYHLLAFHAGPISKFVLSIDFLGPAFDMLIYFLSRNGVQHLDLSFYGYGLCTLPSSIFSCSQLTHLFLTSCSIQLAPPAFKGFDRLISLKLFHVTIYSKILESLICNCLLLEQLGLYYNRYADAIEINAPMLRAFGFTEGTGSICLKSIPHLAKLSLWHVHDHLGIRNCLESCNYLEHLELKGYSLKFLVAAVGEVPTRLPFGLNCLKCLCLIDIYLGELDVVSCVLCLIRSFQYLLYLEIQVADEDDGIPALQCLELEAFSDVTFSHLREVELRRTIGSDPEMQLIKLLLAKSPMLEIMLIKPLLYRDHAGKTLKIPVLLNSDLGCIA